MKPSALRELDECSVPAWITGAGGQCCPTALGRQVGSVVEPLGHVKHMS